MVAPEEPGLSEDIPNFGFRYLLARVGPWAIHRRTSGEWIVTQLRDQPDPSWDVINEWSLGTVLASGDTFGDVLLAAMPDVVPGDIASHLAAMVSARHSSRVHQAAPSSDNLP